MTKKEYAKSLHSYSRINCVEKLVKQCKIKWGTIECSSHFLLESTPYNAVFYKEQKNERLCL